MEPDVDVSFTLDAELWKRIETAAADEGTTVSAMVNAALTRHLSQRSDLIAAWAGGEAARAADVTYLVDVDPDLDDFGCS